MAESVQKFILSTVLFLFIIAIGTRETYTKEADYHNYSSSFYEQQETPFEKTVHYYFLSKIADLPQAMCLTENSILSAYKSTFSFFHNQIPLYKAPRVYDNNTNIHFYTGIEYYIYTLRRIII